MRLSGARDAEGGTSSTIRLLPLFAHDLTLRLPHTRNAFTGSSRHANCLNPHLSHAHSRMFNARTLSFDARQGMEASRDGIGMKKGQNHEAI
jgi:hypothetical protein